MKTFSIQTLGCKVNQYESEQLAAVLRSRGLVPAEGAEADLRIINTCAVTSEASSKSRQLARRAGRRCAGPDEPDEPGAPRRAGDPDGPDGAGRLRVIVTGCWATSEPATAGRIAGVDAVLTHHEDVAASLKRLLDGWLEPGAAPATSASGCLLEPGPGAAGGTTSLPLLSDHAAGHARAFLKVQDGCDAHCTYCIIPRLRPELWSKPLEQAVEEARALVAAGHREIVLTGIFLGAYGQRTALRRRQRAAAGGAASGGGGASLAQLAEALCTRVPGLLRLRFSSLEPMDLSDELIEVLRRLPQVVPHFHLPLQSGSDRLLRRMNRQYRRDEFLRMLDRVRRAFDRPALTTDIICGFPGECDGAFEQTLDIVRRAKFIHVHAFPFSPRPGTAAARWTDDRVPPAIAQARIEQLRQLALDHCQAYRRQFAGETVQVLVERPDATARELGLAHGRCPRYFDVHFHWPQARWGEPIDVRIDRITRTRTFGSVVATAPA